MTEEVEVIRGNDRIRKLAQRVSRVLGTDADHAAGTAIRHADPVLGDLGLTVPGAWNPFEAGVWAILSGGHAGGGQLLAAFVTYLGRPVPGGQAD